MIGRGLAQKSIDLIDHSYRILASMHPATVAAWAHCQAVEKAERESLNAYIRAWPKSIFEPDQKCHDAEGGAP